MFSRFRNSLHRLGLLTRQHSNKEGTLPKDTFFQKCYQNRLKIASVPVGLAGATIYMEYSLTQPKGIKYFNENLSNGKVSRWEINKYELLKTRYVSLFHQDLINEIHRNILAYQTGKKSVEKDIENFLDIFPIQTNSDHFKAHKSEYLLANLLEKERSVSVYLDPMPYSLLRHYKHRINWDLYYQYNNDVLDVDEYYDFRYYFPTKLLGKNPKVKQNFKKTVVHLITKEKPCTFYNLWEILQHYPELVEKLPATDFTSVYRRHADSINRNENDIQQKIAVKLLNDPECRSSVWLYLVEYNPSEVEKLELSQDEWLQLLKKRLSRSSYTDTEIEPILKHLPADVTSSILTSDEKDKLVKTGLARYKLYWFW